MGFLLLGAGHPYFCLWKWIRLFEIGLLLLMDLVDRVTIFDIHLVLKVMIILYTEFWMHFLVKMLLCLKLMCMFNEYRELLHMTQLHRFGLCLLLDCLRHDLLMFLLECYLKLQSLLMKIETHYLVGKACHFGLKVGM